MEKLSFEYFVKEWKGIARGDVETAIRKETCSARHWCWISILAIRRWGSSYRRITGKIEWHEQKSELNEYSWDREASGDVHGDLSRVFRKCEKSSTINSSINFEPLELWWFHWWFQLSIFTIEVVSLIMVQLGAGFRRHRPASDEFSRNHRDFKVDGRTWSIVSRAWTLFYFTIIIYLFVSDHKDL